MDRDLVTRVSRSALGIALLVAAAGGVLAGAAAAFGVLAGALVSVASFRWLARGAAASAGLLGGGGARPLWMLGLGLRYLVLFGCVAGALRAGLPPLAVVAGLSVLPPVLISIAWHGAREAV